MRIVVLGANGQVGGELCLYLSRYAEVDLLAVCRNRFGSAFLRASGIKCVHTDLSDPAQCKAVLEKADVVVNLVLVEFAMNARQAEETNYRILLNVISALGSSGTHIYMSTMSVYGDKRHDQTFVFKNAYASLKLKSELLAQRLGTEHSCPTVIFRLGHVCGELQGITQQLRALVATNKEIQISDPDRPSNTVHVATIADAVLKASLHRSGMYTFDLMNVPQWTWRDVLLHEGYPPDARFTDCKVVTRNARHRVTQIASASLARIAVLAGANTSIRKFAGRFLRHLPLKAHMRIKATYSIKAAGAEISRLRPLPQSIEAFDRAPIEGKYLSGLENTSQLLQCTRTFDVQHIIGASESTPVDLIRVDYCSK